MLPPQSQSTNFYSTQNSEASALKVTQIYKRIALAKLKRNAFDRQALARTNLSQDAATELKQALQSQLPKNIKVPADRAELEDKLPGILVQAAATSMNGDTLQAQRKYLKAQSKPERIPVGVK